MGNTTPSAEHNFFVDPSAAAIVFDAGIPLVISGLDLTRQVAVPPVFMKRLRAQNTKVSGVIADIIESRPPGHFEPGMTVSILHDPTVVGYLLSPDLFKGRQAYVTIETASEFCAGRSNIHFESSKPGNAFVLEEVNVEGFYELILNLLSVYEKQY